MTDVFPSVTVIDHPLAAQARVRDTHGRTHYLMVEPDVDDEVFDEGAQILIVRKVGAFYRCIANPHPALM